MSIFDKTKDTLQQQILKLSREICNFKAFVLKEMRTFKDDIKKMLSRAEKNLLLIDDVVDTLFGEELDEHSDTLEWDGNTAGCVQVGSVYKISDATPTKEDLANGFTLMMEINGVEKDFTSAATEGTNRPIVIYDGKLLMIGLYVFIVHEPCTYLGNTYNEKGTYFFKTDTMRVTSFKVNGYTGFVIRQFKPQFVDAYTKDQTNTLVRDTKNELSEEIADVRTDAHLEVVVEKRERESSINELDGRIDALESRGGSGGSGATSWKDLGESPTGSDTLTWDGNADESAVKVYYNGTDYFIHVSDSVFTLEQAQSSTWTKYVISTGKIVGSSGYSWTKDTGIIISSDYGIACVESDGVEYNGFVFPKKGTYICGGNQYVTSITIPSFDGFPSVKPIDTKYLPLNIFIVNLTETESGFSKDKTFAEIADAYNNGKTVYVNYFGKLFAMGMVSMGDDGIDFIPFTSLMFMEGFLLVMGFTLNNDESIEFTEGAYQLTPME